MIVYNICGLVANVVCLFPGSGYIDTTKGKSEKVVVICTMTPEEEMLQELYEWPSWTVVFSCRPSSHERYCCTAVATVDGN